MLTVSKTRAVRDATDGQDVLHHHGDQEEADPDLLLPHDYH